MNPKKDLPAKGRATLRDSDVPGLELRGNQKRATWTLRHRVEGERIRDVIGHWPGLTAKAARDAARARLAGTALTLAAGGDVLGQRREQHKHKNARTFGDALAAYVEQRRELRTIGHADSVIRAVFCKLIGDRLPTLTKPRVLACADAKRKTAPAVADMSIRYLRPFLKWAYDRDEVSAELLTLRVGQTKKRDRYLTVDELGRVVVALDGMGTHVGALTVQMMIATAQRRDEVGEMLWDEVSGDLWTVPGARTKTGRDYSVPLNSRALWVLDQMRETTGAGELVFAGRTGVTPFNGWSGLKTKLDGLAGVSGWVLHDLRRTFVTLCADRGVDPVTADRCLNHVGAGTLSDVARRYQQSSFVDQKRDAFELWDGIVWDAVAKTTGANVVQISAKAGPDVA